MNRKTQMKHNSGQALIETLIVFPVLLLAGFLAAEGARIVAIKSYLLMTATSRAQELAASELQWEKIENPQNEDVRDTGTEETKNSSLPENLLDFSTHLIEKDLMDQQDFFGWDVHQRSMPLRWYATHRTGNMPGISVQLNACIPLLVTLWTRSSLNDPQKYSEKNRGRDCLGQFENSTLSVLAHTGVVRLRIAAFAPRHASYHIYSEGLAIPKKMVGVEKLVPDLIVGSEKNDNNSHSRIRNNIFTKNFDVSRLQFTSYGRLQ